jgi:hypothetical protein
MPLRLLQNIRQMLLDIQEGRKEGPDGWVKKVYLD